MTPPPPEAAGVAAPDGSPVEVFRLLPPGPAPGLVHAAVDPGTPILELGCGAGRLTRALVGLGHPVVAVDICGAMLACLAGTAGVSTVEADIAGLDLGRTFGGVVLASYLLNHPGAGSFLATCRRHVADDGAVVVQRYDPWWAGEGMADATTAGNVTVAVDAFSLTAAPPSPSGEPRCPSFSAVVTYTVGGRAWEQPISAVILDDPDVGRLALQADLVVDRWLDEHRTWARLIPSPPPSAPA